MGYTYSFFDNQKIGATELNKLAKRFVTGGIADIFKDGMPYNISVLNNIAYANVTGGVVPDTVSSLKVYVSGNNIIVSPGNCFFDDGTYMEVDSSGITLNFIPNATNYIYLISDSISGECRCENRTSPLTDGVFLLLATVNSNKTITDKRTFAKGKIPSAYASGYSLSSTFSVTWTAAELNGNATKEIVLPAESIRGLFCNFASANSKYCGFATFDGTGNANRYYSGSLEGSLFIASQQYFSEQNLIICNDYNLSVFLSVSAKTENGKLILTPSRSFSNNNHDITANFYIF
jgi:hypothetical protein